MTNDPSILPSVMVPYHEAKRNFSH